jgi:hypothetical protein
MGHIEHPTQKTKADFVPMVKRPRCEAEHLFPLNAEVMIASVTPLPQHVLIFMYALF